MSEDRRTKGYTTLTTGGTSAMVAKKSQIRPCDEKDISDPSGRVVLLLILTCLQRNFPKANMEPCRRKRSRPASIVRSRTTSETNTAKMVVLLLKVCRTTQTP